MNLAYCLDLNRFLLRNLLPGLILFGCGLSESVAVRYVDASALTVYNRHDKSEKGYARIDLPGRHDIPERIRRYSGYSSGLAVAFTTDSRMVSARWATAYPDSSQNTSLLLQSGLDFYIRQNSQWIHAGVGLPSPGSVSTSVIVGNMDGSSHTCLLYLPMLNAVKNLEIGIDDDADISPCPGLFDRKKVVVVGSSITHGVAASRPGLAYPARLQRALDMEFVNLGYCGLCRLDDVFADMIISSDADAAVVDAFSNPSPDEICDRLENFVERISRLRPGMPVIFLQTLVRETGNFNLKKRSYESRKRMAASRIMDRLVRSGKYPDLYFIEDAMPLGSGHEHTADGTHPTDAGFENIVSHLQPVLTRILESYAAPY